MEEVLEDQIKEEVQDKVTDALINSVKSVEKVTTQSTYEDNPNSQGCKTTKKYWGLFRLFFIFLIIFIVDIIKGAKIIAGIINGIMGFFDR